MRDEHAGAAAPAGDGRRPAASSRMGGGGARRGARAGRAVPARPLRRRRTGARRARRRAVAVRCGAGRRHGAPPGLLRPPLPDGTRAGRTDRPAPGRGRRHRRPAGRGGPAAGGRGGPLRRHGAADRGHRDRQRAAAGTGARRVRHAERRRPRRHHRLDGALGQPRRRPRPAARRRHRERPARAGGVGGADPRRAAGPGAAQPRPAGAGGAAAGPRAAHRDPARPRGPGRHRLLRPPVPVLLRDAHLAARDPRGRRRGLTGRRGRPAGPGRAVRRAPVPARAAPGRTPARSGRMGAGRVRPRGRRDHRPADRADRRAGGLGGPLRASAPGRPSPWR